eukprot:7442633-Pyramimonas_sp.AAC.1
MHREQSGRLLSSREAGGPQRHCRPGSAGRPPEPVPIPPLLPVEDGAPSPRRAGFAPVPRSAVVFHRRPLELALRVQAAMSCPSEVFPELA